MRTRSTERTRCLLAGEVDIKMARNLVHRKVGCNVQWTTAKRAALYYRPSESAIVGLQDVAAAGIDGVGSRKHDTGLKRSLRDGARTLALGADDYATPSTAAV